MSLKTLEAVEQLCCGVCCEATEQDTAHAGIEEHLACFRKALVVLGQAPVASKPCKCPLDHPTPWKHMKTRGDLRRLLPGSDPEPMIARLPVLRDCKLPSQVLCQPVLQATIGTVAPHQLNGRKQVL